MRRWLLRAVARLLPSADREFLLGDFEERSALRHRHRFWSVTLADWRDLAMLLWHCTRFRRPPAIRSDPAQRGDSQMRSLTGDFRFALRSIVRQPLYAAIAVLSLAVAIGANGLVFGLVDNLVLNPFRFPEADRLVSVGSAFPRLNIDEGFVEQHSPLEIDDMRRASSLANVAAFDLGNRAVSNGAEAQRVFTALLLDDPLPAMGQPPVLGRGFSGCDQRT
jgi:hypothetical protein